MKKIILLLAILTSIIACNKDDENTVLTPAEQSIVDHELMIEYMKSYKFEDFYVGDMVNNIDWKIVELDEEDTEETVTLFDLMGENVIKTTTDGVDYYMYYYVKNAGIGDQVTDTDDIYVDYNLFSLYGSEMNNRLDYSDFARKFNVPSLIEGWRLGLVNFNSGVKPDEFPGESPSPYRELVDTPGRGIFLVPSGLGYNSGVLRFDIVIYDNIAVEEE